MGHLLKHIIQLKPNSFTVFTYTRLSCVNWFLRNNIIIKAMAKIVLWANEASPPSWAVRMLAHIIGVELDIHNLNLMTRQHRSPEHLMLNPMGTVPTIKDGDFVISESHTIMMYLLEKYGTAHKERLYPSEIKARALVDQAMYFDTGVAFIRIKEVAIPAIRHGAKSIAPEVETEIDRTYSTLNVYLEKHTYAAANHFTLADICLGSTIFALRGLYEVDAATYPKLAAWLSQLEKEPCFKEIANSGAALLELGVKTLWEKNSKGN